MAPQSSLNFRELQTRVAETLGVQVESGGVNAPPSDTVMLDRVKRAINDAAREFAKPAPVAPGRSHRWNWLSPTVTITAAPDADSPYTVGGVNYQYALPSGVSPNATARMTWASADSIGSGVVIHRDISSVSMLLARDPSRTGPPELFAVTLTPGQKQGERRRFVLVIYPRPDQAYTLSCRFRMAPTLLVDDGDRGDWPPEHDDTVLALAVLKLIAQGGAFTSGPSLEAAQAAYAGSLASSIAVDMELAPASMGQLGARDYPAYRDQTTFNVYGTLV